MSSLTNKPHKPKSSSKTFELLSNKKNLWKFEIYDTYECGLVLNSEGLKKILNYKVSLSGSYGWIKQKEIFVRNFLDEEVKLLLKKTEIRRIVSLVKEKKYALIPSKVYLKNYKVKLEMTLSKINKLNNKDKLNTLKEKSWKKANMQNDF